MGTRELHGERGREEKREKEGKGKFCEDWSLTALAVRRGESLEQTAPSSRRHRYISSFLQPSPALPPRRSLPPRHFKVLFAYVAQELR